MRNVISYPVANGGVSISREREKVMAVAAMWIALVSSGLTVTQETVGLVQVIKAAHHHTTRPLYRHVLRPIGKELTK